jgi:hypothetical protein
MLYHLIPLQPKHMKGNDRVSIYFVARVQDYKVTIQEATENPHRVSGKHTGLYCLYHPGIAVFNGQVVLSESRVCHVFQYRLFIFLFRASEQDHGHFGACPYKRIRVIEVVGTAAVSRGLVTSVGCVCHHAKTVTIGIPKPCGGAAGFLPTGGMHP